MAADAGAASTCCARRCTSRRLVALLDRAWDDEFLDGFLALETWGNDNVSFPGECYVRYIEELYRNDALMNGTFAVARQRRRARADHVPDAGVAFEHDNIVPLAERRRR